MKYYILKQIAQYMGNFTTINHLKRINNNTIRIEFNDKKTLYFDMTKGNATVFRKNERDMNGKIFNAPFDVTLQKRFNNAKIEKIYLRNNDKILNIITKSKSSYKEQITILQLEFTGKNTNIIILDTQDTVLEALRHIDEWTSTRIVKVGHTLDELEKPNFTYEINSVANIEEYLLSVYTQRTSKELENSKKQKNNQLQKQIQKIQKIINNLEDIEQLEEKVENFNQEAINIVGNLYLQSGYEKQKNIKKSNDLFRDSKKAKAKVKNQYIEQLNLSQKLNFYQRLVDTVKHCKSIDEIEFYFPKKDKNQIKTKKQNPYQAFFIDGYKIMLGRDERENIYLLEHSKASDFWFHLQGIPSSHVLVSCTKKTIPQNIIEEAAKICARFSMDNGGKFSVDYTQRRNVKIQNKANVLYNPYTTIEVKI